MELYPFISALTSINFQKKPNVQNPNFWQGRLDIYVGKYGHTNYRLLILCAKNTGPLDTTIDLTALCTTFPIDVIIMVGICAGNLKIVHLGDIVCSTHGLNICDGAKIAKLPCCNKSDQQKKLSLGEHVSCTHRINKTNASTLTTRIQTAIQLVSNSRENVNHPNFFISECFNSVIHRIQKIDPQIFFGTTLSTPEVRTDGVFGDDNQSGIQEIDRNVIALDMEAYSVARVAESFNKFWTVIKTVVDGADENKNNDYHMFGKELACSFVIELIKLDFLGEFKSIGK